MRGWGLLMITVRRAVRVPSNYCAVAGNCCAHSEQKFIWRRGWASEEE